MHLDNISVYKAYIKDTKSLKDLNKLFLFSDMNNIDLDTVSEYLPTLTEVKEMIIVYIYIYLQVAQVYRQ
jgi:hypothetical protein